MSFRGTSYPTVLEKRGLTARGKANKVNSYHRNTLEAPKTINQLYDICFGRITQLLEGERITRIRNLTWLIVGIFLSKSVQMNKIGLKIPGDSKELSVVRRLGRFLCNPGFNIRMVYEPVVKDWLKSLAASQGRLMLIIDGTQVGFGQQMIMVSAAYHHRALPIAWTWVPGTTRGMQR